MSPHFEEIRPDDPSAKIGVPRPGVDSSSAKKAPVDWEGLIGGKWALWVGSFSLFLAVACFLGYTWTTVWSHLPPPTPEQKTAMGFGAGLFLMVLGAVLRTRTQRWYSEGLTGAGLGISYLSLWAGAEYFHILNSGVAFAAMTALTALGVILAVQYRALSLSWLGGIGGFLTPMLLQGSGGSSNPLGFLVYIALLNFGLIAVALWRSWRSLSRLSFALTVISVWWWVGETNLDSARMLTWSFFTLYALLFSVAALYPSLEAGEETTAVDLLLFTSTTILYAVAGEMLLSPLLERFPGLFLVAVAVAHGGFTLVLRRVAPGNRLLQFTAQGLALSALTLAIPVQLHDPYVQAESWVLESVILVLGSRRSGDPLFRVAGRMVWLLSAFWVAVSWLSAHIALNDVMTTAALKPHLLFLNDGALPLTTAVVGAYLMTTVGWQNGQGPATGDDFLTLYAVYGPFAGAWLVAQETALACRWEQYPSPAGWADAGPVFLGSLCVGSYALLMCAAAARVHHLVLCRCAQWLALASAAVTLWSSLFGLAPGGAPFWNIRFAAILLISGILPALGRSRRGLVRETAWDDGLYAAWPSLCAAFTLAGLSLEVGTAVSHGTAPQDWSPFAAFALAAFWCLAGPVCVKLGWLRRDGGVRALGYLAAGVGAFTWTAAANLNGPSGAPGWNLPFWAGLAAVAGCAATAKLAGNADPDDEYCEVSLASLFSVVAGFLLFIVLTAECRYAFWTHRAELYGHWQVIAYFAQALLWTALGAIAMARGCRRGEALARGLGYAGHLAGAAVLLADACYFVPLWRPVFNPRFADFVAVAAFWALGVWLLRSNRAVLTAAERHVPLTGALGTVGLLLIGCSQEIFEGCRWYAAALGNAWPAVGWYLVVVLWMGIALGLCWSGMRRANLPLRLAGYYLGAAAISVLLLTSLCATQLGWTPILNPRFLAFALSVEGLALVVSRLHREAFEIHGAEADWTLPFALLGLVLLGWCLTQETYEAAFTSRALLGGQWDHFAQVGISGVWSLYGATLLVAGVLRPNRPQRLLALGLLYATVFKVFVLDLAFLDGPMLILSLGGLGISLLFISWLYGRFGTVTLSP